MSLTELFYDLVFVYAVSQITEIFEPLHHHELTWMTVALYIGVFISFIGSWNIQTVYFNRFGEHQFKDIIFMTALQMPILLFIAQYTNVENFDDFRLFSIGLALLSAVHIFQYAWIAVANKKPEDKQVALTFIYLLSARFIGIVIGAIVGGVLGFAIVTASVIIFLLYPLIFIPATTKVPLNVPHLIERLQLLTIITFGELIVGQAKYFKFPDFTPISYVGFIVIVNLFMFYIVEFDHLIDETISTSKATLLIYFHYLIWFGINLVTVAYDFVDINNPTSGNTILTIGIALLYIGVLIHVPFHKDSRHMTWKELAPVIIPLMIGIPAEFIVISSPYLYGIITLIYTFISMAFLMRFQITRLRAEMDDDIDIE